MHGVAYVMHAVSSCRMRADACACVVVLRLYALIQLGHTRQQLSQATRSRLKKVMSSMLKTSEHTKKHHSKHTPAPPAAAADGVAMDVASRAAAVRRAQMMATHQADMAFYATQQDEPT